MKKYQQPTIDIRHCQAEDIITSSGLTDQKEGLDPFVGDFY